MTPKNQRKRTREELKAQLQALDQEEKAEMAMAAKAAAESSGDLYVKVAHLHQYRGIPKSTAHRWAATDSTFPCSRGGRHRRIRLSAFDAWMEGRN